jgi:hypothetical protein
MRDSFIFYRSFFESTIPLSDEQKAQLFNKICEYSLNQTETKTEPLVNAMFALIKPQLDANNRRFENGSKGGRPKEETKTKPKHNQTITKVKPNANVNVNVNVNENVKEKEKEKFLIPKIEECISYFLEKESSQNEAESFFNFYESKGWLVGKVKMKNWKAAASGWMSRNKNSGVVPYGQPKPMSDSMKAMLMVKSLEEKESQQRFESAMEEVRKR